MNSETQRVIDQCVAASHAGTGNFGEQVMLLSRHGVESYHVDFRARGAHYFSHGDAVYRVDIDPPREPSADRFDAAALIEAIRGSQQGLVKYPEFVQRALSAGVVAYTVWIAGRHVIYFGRRGESHLERFPEAS